MYHGPVSEMAGQTWLFSAPPLSGCIIYSKTFLLPIYLSELSSIFFMAAQKQLSEIEVFVDVRDGLVTIP